MAEGSQVRLNPSLSPKAKGQWRRILEFYNKRNQSADYSLKLDVELHRMLNHLCSQPELGQETRRKNIRRRVIEKRFAVFYRVKGETLEVTVIVDARQDRKLD